MTACLKCATDYSEIEASRVLNECEWDISSRKRVSVFVNSFKTKYNSFERNPNRRWKDSVLTEAGVPSRASLLRTELLIMLRSVI